MSDGVITIGKSDFQAKYVQSVLDKIDSSHIEYVIRSFTEASKQHPIKNIKKYLLTSLVNAPMTIDAYYQSAVNYDFG